MNVKLAANLLESISEEEFKSGSIVTIFNKVLDELLSFEVISYYYISKFPRSIDNKDISIK